MRATAEILGTWQKFDAYPMETITKAWYLRQAAGAKQRTVEQMEAHREQYGTSGNCYDLAIWLIDAFRRDGLTSYAILTPDDHVAAVVLDEAGSRYLCDLGDQWIEPILIEKRSGSYTEEFLDGFFPGARVKLESLEHTLNVSYRRPNGKTSKQTYLLQPVSDEQLLAKGEQTQRTLWSPLVEQRIFTPDEVIHWEFDNYTSFYSSKEGKKLEPKLQTIDEWAARIHKASGISPLIVREALAVYREEAASGER